MSIFSFISLIGEANVEDVEKRTGKRSNKTVDALGAEENAKDRRSCSGHH